MKKSNKAISVFSLAMINVAAVASIRGWPMFAENGFSLVFYIVLAALLFFLPAALVSAELATGWPNLGGIFSWVKNAFGHRMGFLAVWLLWIENVPYYPTILSFAVGTFAYIIDPGLASNKYYLAGSITAIFWVSTLLNMMGMKISSLISTVGVLLGTVFPTILIIGFGAYWLIGNHPIQIECSWNALTPKIDGISNIVLFVAILQSFMGIEMSAVHARDVQHPKINFPRAIMIAIVMILTMTIFGSLAIASVVPKEQLSFNSGSIQAFTIMTTKIGLPWLTKWMAFFITLGALATMFTWTIGPSKGLLAAAAAGDLPPFFRKVNKKGMPTNLLLTQAVIVTFLSLVFVILPNANAALWALVAIASPLYLLMYILLFAAGIKLRYKKPNVERHYRVPFGNKGMWLIAGSGIICSVLTVIVSLFPTDDFKGIPTAKYMTILSLSIIVATSVPFIILRFQKPHWKKRLKHEEDLEEL